MSETEITAELDARHAAAHLAYERRDLDAYRALFAPALVYRRIDGRVIGRDALMRDVARQFRNLSRVASSFERANLTLSSDEAIERLVQRGSVQATAFVLVHRSWALVREGDYAWIRQNGVWVIREVKILSESTSPTGWRFGAR